MTEQPPNRLADSASPYLRSAAHQPVRWFAWGDEAFARAQAEDKPILLDIGATWCHWCHVIDRESYENPDIAAIINEHYVAVKVDRDERPDVDARYQAAISAISGQGGWPLTGFLTSDGRPFFGGTYFPPDDAMGRPGFKRILVAIADAYKSRRADVERSASALADAVAKAESFTGARADFAPEVVDHLVDSVVRLFDLRNGGFGQSPKFPHPAAMELLLERYQATRESSLLTVITTTLDRMARGGVYDHLAGGFHRYSVDERWLVPHFEKMSYDNSELLRNYLHAFQVTGTPLYRRVAEGIVGWVQTTLADRERGGFYASQDADYSLEDDGDYFTWTLDELRSALAEDEARVAALYFGVSERGHMHHKPEKCVLHVERDVAAIAEELGIEEAQVEGLLSSARAKLLDARAKRPTPCVDTTLYVGWNAMMAAAFLDAGRVLDRADCRDFALRTLNRLLAEGRADDRGFAHRIGGDWLEGTLDDQVHAAAALLDAFEATLDRRWFDAAERTAALLLEKYWDAAGGGFFDRAADAPAMGGLDVRRKPLQDSPTPGANAIAAIVLMRLHGFSGDRLYYDRARQTLEAFAGVAPQYGMFAASYGLAALVHARHPLQVVVTGAQSDGKAEELERAALAVHRFGKAVLRLTPERLAAGALPAALRETLPALDAARPQALVCVETACQPPTDDPLRLRALLTEVAAGAAAGGTE